MELIRLDIEAVKRHTEANSPAMIVEQYQELRDEHLEELRTLLAGSGINIELFRQFLCPFFVLDKIRSGINIELFRLQNVA